MRWEKIKQLHFGNQVNYDMQLKFCNLFGFNRCLRFSVPLQFKNFVEGKRGYSNSSKGWDTPRDDYSWMDHGEAFKNVNDNEVMVISHLYDDMEGAFQEVAKIVNPIGLRAVVFNAEASWYYPKVTTMVVIMSDKTFKNNQHLFSKVTSKYLTV